MGNNFYLRSQDLVERRRQVVSNLVHYRHAVGNLSNVATILSEMGDNLNDVRLNEAAEIATTPELQRLGYLFELVEQNNLASCVAGALQTRRVRPVALSPGRAYLDAPRNERWNLYINDRVELDL